MTEQTKKRKSLAQMWYGLKEDYNCNLATLIPASVWGALDSEDSITVQGIKLRSFFADGGVVGFGVLLGECVDEEPKAISLASVKGEVDDIAPRVARSFGLLGIADKIDDAHIRVGVYLSVDDRQ